MRLSRGELEARIVLLEQVERGTYPHGLDLRPLSFAVACRWASVAVSDRGTLRLGLTAKGKQALASGRVALGIGGGSD